MTRAQFLNELYRRLPGLTQEQAEQHLTYYAEMLADRMEEGMSEEEAVASMEPVDVIAQRILQDEGVPEGQPPAGRTCRRPTAPGLPKRRISRREKIGENWRRFCCGRRLLPQLSPLWGGGGRRISPPLSPNPQTRRP